MSDAAAGGGPAGPPGSPGGAPSRPTLRLPPWAILAAATLAAGVAAMQDSPSAAVLRGLTVAVLAWCAIIDLEHRLIPNRITGPAALTLVVGGLALDLDGEPGRLLAAVLAGGFLLVAAIARPGGMGMGDVKLTAVMGLGLGAPVAMALIAALVASVLTGGVLAVRHGVRAARKTAIPFGPYLAFGGILAALIGDAAIHAYLHTR